MPYSTNEGKGWTKQVFDKLCSDPFMWDVRHVVDVGPGAGTYYDMLSLDGQKWTAIEKWGPYIRQFGLDRKYDDVIVADIKHFDWRGIDYADVVILGDVIEHLPFADGRIVIDAALDEAGVVILSLPIHNYVQGEEYGNPYEAHLTQWNDQDVRDWFGDNIVASFVGDVVGVYVMAGQDRSLLKGWLSSLVGAE